MMLRVVVRTDNAGMAAHVGGAPITTWRSFDIEAPMLEAFLREELGDFAHRQAAGVELMHPEDPEQG